jgi:DNA-directed RNA polymerase specialized sigma24 family protein
MSVGLISVGGENSRYAGPKYQKHYARLRDNFLSLLGDAREADDCLDETLQHFSQHLQSRPRESDARLLTVCLPRIAGAVGSKRLAAQRLRRQNSLFNRFRREAARTFREGFNVTEFAHRLAGVFRLPRLKPLPAPSR